MTLPLLLTGQVYAVEVPEHLLQQEYQFEQSIARMLKGDKGDDELAIVGIMKKCGSGFDEITVSLPDPGNWQLIGTTKEVTEEVAEQIVQVISNGKISGRPQYRRYDRDPVKDTPARSWTRDPRHSFETLLTSKGLDNTKNYVLIKKL